MRIGDRSVLVGLCVAGVIATQAAAQTPPWAAGTWQGTLQNYPNDRNGADRVLAIAATGACVWDTPAKIGDVAKRLAAASAAKTCTFTGDGVSLQSGPGSTIQLQHKDGKLQGTFQLKTGSAYHIALVKQ